ncbi:MAG: hypothetical protein LBQ74_20650, partial [Prevotella sp.]|nr:hypothetical protein [Prevotella sp.]
SGAMDWYNASVGVLAKQKSTADSSDEISYKPSGNLAELFTDELWYAVESPLDFGDRNLMIMTPEVNNYAETHGDNAAKQEMKLVVLRNKETGETYSFIMAVVPELDYMLRKGDELDKSTYLSPNSDFDGYIFFYTLDGELINGRMYEGGKITGTINSPVEGKKTKIMMAYQMAIRYSWEQTAGGIIDGEFKTTEPKTHSEIVYVTVYKDNGIGINNTPPPPTPPTIPSSGGGNGSYTGNNPKLKLTPLPLDAIEEPTDPCKSMTNKILSADFKKAITDLQGLTGSNYEGGRAYSYKDGKYTFTNHNGSAGKPEINYNPTNISKIDGFIHSHYDGLLKTFSPSDLVVPYVWFVKNSGINNMNTFSLGLVTSEGTYFLYISDWTKYREFGQTYGANEEKLDALSFMYENVYKISTSASAAVSMQNLVKLLNVTDSGLTLMKDVGDNKYSIVTTDSKGNVKYTNCN